MENDINVLIGKVIESIQVYWGDLIVEDKIIFNCNDGESYAMTHLRDCCEAVEIEDINGDTNDLIGSAITVAEVVCSNTNPVGIEKDCQDSFTWTFYKLATVKGFVDIRWYGESNGYYSEEVDFYKL